ncbi:MAG TPA: crosslink repair DNA glycosylase YcaQ family protein [Gaiellaceae bacterium]|nr:crosslink repair DNA glycosylase YcaQ family protein [Gaiellaceae bacterium]
MPKSLTTVSLAEIRRRVVEAQGYASRSRTGTAAEVLAAVRRAGCIQLDSVSTVERSHRIALGARVGAYPEPAVSRLVRTGRLFEFWAHEACLLPVEDYPMHRWRMARFADMHPWHGNVLSRETALTRQVLAEIEERGPLGSRHFEGTGSGGMWNWKPAKVVLEALYSAGRLAIAGRDGFQRLYDLPERVLPAEVLNGGPPPDDDAYTRWATLRGVDARGALTEGAVAEMWRLRGGAARVRPHADALVAEGTLERLAVDDGKAPVLVRRGVEPGGGAVPRALLLSPFDNLLWDRAFLERVFGFTHVIEIYKREHERVYGYYVLPLLRRDRLVGRADLKHDRAEGVLRVKAFHPEPGARGDLDATLDAALLRLSRVLGAKVVLR